MLRPCLAVVLLAATPACTKPNPDWTFAAGWSEPEASNTTSISVGDFDNDGYPDLVFGNSGEANLAYVNNGNGTFRETWRSEFRETTTTVSLCALEMSQSSSRGERSR